MIRRRSPPGLFQHFPSSRQAIQGYLLYSADHSATSLPGLLSPTWLFSDPSGALGSSEDHGAYFLSLKSFLTPVGSPLISSNYLEALVHCIVSRDVELRQSPRDLPNPLSSNVLVDDWGVRLHVHLLDRFHAILWTTLARFFDVRGHVLATVDCLESPGRC